MEPSQDQPSTVIPQILRGTIWSLLFPVSRTERLAQLAAKDDPLPKCAGIYRIHLRGCPILAYVGQSGDIRRRINELRGVMDEEMPFTDPHVAAPCLWAWQQIPPQRPLSVSFAPISCSAYWLQGYEDLVLALERWKLKHLALPPPWKDWRSSLANYHKFPAGWMSSSSRAKGIRGGPTPFFSVCHSPGIAPLGEFDDPRDPVEDLEWGGYGWSAWRSTREKQDLADAQGLYRLRWPDDPRLFFIGHGLLEDAARNAARGHPDMLLSYAVGNWTYHEQLELLTDCLGLYLRQTGTLPLAQYGGESNPHAGSSWPLPDDVSSRRRTW